MFKHTQEEQHTMPMGNNHQETIIAQGVKVEGDFHSQGDVVIDGEVSGSVETAQALRVGDRAIIRANVSAANAVIAGTVEGNLRVSGMLEILASARVEGDVETQTISIAPGATMNGRLSMTSGKSSSPVSKE
jgi:cytoskeletal protein CcmA (bactofilin family)